MWGLGVLIPLLGASTLQVSQYPGELRVSAGSRVALGCQVLVTEPWDLLRIEWVKDGEPGVLCATRLRPTTPISSSNCTTHHRLAWHQPCATLSLHQAQGVDAGRYLCQVTLEIPRLSTATGNGTLLSISTAADDQGYQTGLMWGLAGSLGGTALLLGLVLLTCWRWRSNSGAGIYLNVLPPSSGALKKPLPPSMVKDNNTYHVELQCTLGLPVPPRP